MRVVAVFEWQRSFCWRPNFGNARGTLEGSRRAFSAEFIRTLADDFRLHGSQAIEKVRNTQPAAYMKICALLVPREMKVEHSNPIKGLTDEQLGRVPIGVRFRGKAAIEPTSLNGRE